MDALMLDGNAIAGMLQEVCAVEMTMAMGTCGNCGATEPMGATHVFKGAGVVMRCPHCDTVLAKVVRSDTRLWLSFPGMRALEVRP